jgi:hypothetical protein
LFILGCASLIIGRTEKNSAYKAFIILLVGSFVVYFVMHSLFWWKGLFGSLGLHRVMAGVAPLFSIVALLGYNAIAHFLPNKVNLQKIVLSLILVAVVIFPFKQYRPPLKPDNELQVLIKTSEWIKNNAISTDKKVYCMYPAMAMFLNKDVFDIQKYSSTCVLKNADFNANLLPGDLIIWDSHFGHECGFTPDDIAQLPKIKKIGVFSQSKESNQQFEVMVFTVVN